MSSTGPNRTPVGACATVVESLDIGFDTVPVGKARLCFVGACDMYGDEAAQEFRNMKTVLEQEERTLGRIPKEMSRSATTTRKGFVESEGASVQVVTSAKLALEMGLPIWSIVGLTATASDEIGCLFVQGQGILALSREDP